MELSLDIMLQIFNIIPFQISLIPPYYSITLFWLNLANVLCTSPCTTGYHEGYSQTKIDTQANNSYPGNYLTVKEMD